MGAPLLRFGDYTPPAVQTLEAVNSEPSLELEKVKALAKNLRTLNKIMDQNGKIDPSKIRIVSKEKNGFTVQMLEINGVGRQLQSKGKNHSAQINNFIDHLYSEIQAVENYNPQLAIAASRHNQQISKASELPSHSPSERKISLATIENKNLLGIEIKKFKNVEVRGPRKEVETDRPDMIQQKRGFSKHFVRSYREDKIDHQGKESLAIFLPTQFQRLKNLFLRFARVLGIPSEKLTAKLTEQLRKHDYYHGLDKSEYEPIIYTNDSPLAFETKDVEPGEPLPSPTSYWLGHASVLLGMTVRSEEDPARATTLRVIIDPVEGALAPLFYSRMTKEGAPLEETPAPQVYLLSHNHFDHYDDKALVDKILSQQPVIVVPKGDGGRYRDMQFKHVIELDWWQSASLDFEEDELTYKLNVNAVPARHWAGQGPCGGHESTFLGYVIEHEDGDIYVAGDTARLSSNEESLVTSSEEKEFRKELWMSDYKQLVRQVDRYRSVAEITAKNIVKLKEQAERAKSRDRKDVLEVQVELHTKELDDLIAKAEIAQHVLELKSLHKNLIKEVRKKERKLESCKDEEKRQCLEGQIAFLAEEIEIAESYAQSGEKQRISHVDALREMFNIKYSFQPGGPDEERKNMQSTHQASVDGLWMHVKLLLHKIYEPEEGIEEFFEKASDHKTVYMHTMTYKLGNLQLFDTPRSLSAVLTKLEDSNVVDRIEDYEESINMQLQIMAMEKYKMPDNASVKQKNKIEEKRRQYMEKKRNAVILSITGVKSYEWQVICEIVQFCKEMNFANEEHITPSQMALLLRDTVIVPKIGSQIALNEPKSRLEGKLVF